MNQAGDLHFHLHLPKSKSLPPVHLHLHLPEDCECDKSHGTGFTNGGLNVDCPAPNAVWNVTSGNLSCAHGSAILSGHVADSVKCQVTASCSVAEPTGPFDIATIASNGSWSVSLSNVNHNTYGNAPNCLWVFASFGGGAPAKMKVPFTGRTNSRHCDGSNPSTLCPDRAGVGCEPSSALLSDRYALLLEVKGRDSREARQLRAELGDDPVVLTYAQHDGAGLAQWKGQVKSLGRFTLSIQDNAGYFAARVALDIERAGKKQLVWATERFIPEEANELTLTDAAMKLPPLLIKPMY